MSMEIAVKVEAEDSGKELKNEGAVRLCEFSQTIFFLN